MAGSILVKFGINYSDNNVLTKNVLYYSGGTVECYFYENVDRLNPRLVVDNGLIDLESTNYMEIPEFGRKYFITNVVGEPGGRYVIHGHVDVLSTYDEAIRNCPIIAARSSNLYNGYLQDEKRLQHAYTYNYYKKLGEISPPNTLVLATVGSPNPSPEPAPNDNNN